MINVPGNALETLAGEQASADEMRDALNVLIDYVADQTASTAYLTPGATTSQIRAVCVHLLDASRPVLPANALIWILGKINDPSLEPDYKRWLHRYAAQLKSANAALHNALVILDVLAGNTRLASITAVEENLRRAEDYLEEQLPW